MLEFGIFDAANYKNSFYVLLALLFILDTNQTKSIRCNVSAEWHSL